MSDSSNWTDNAAGQARATAERVGEKARDAGGTVHDRVRDQVDERSSAAGEQTGQVGEAVRDVSGRLHAQGNDLPARVADEVANRIEGLARYLRDSDGDRILHDLEDFGRRQPLVVAAIGLAAGVATARLMKASGSRSRSGASQRDWGSGSRASGGAQHGAQHGAPMPVDGGTG